MNLHRDFYKPIISLVIMFILLSYTNLSRAGEAQCSDVWDRGHLNVLTINLAFLELKRRDERLESLVNFAETKALAGEPIDVILIQEGVAGHLVGTGSGSPRDLQIKLRERELVYDLEAAIETGIPGIIITGNAILSRCEISFKFSTFLPITSEQIEIEGLGNFALPVSRNLMVVRIKIPGASDRFRKINVYNTHLCAEGGGSAVIQGIEFNTRGCTVNERENQLLNVLKYVKIAEKFLTFSGDKPHVLGGDFNIDNFRGGEPEQFGNEKPLYDMITDAGFIDAYAQAQMDGGILLEDLCVRTEDQFEPFPDQFPGIYQDWGPDVHCTTGVSYLGNNGLFPEFFDTTPRRIDYVFQKGFGVENSEVIFNPNASLPKPLEPVVSDHGGVLIRILLQ